MATSGSDQLNTAEVAGGTTSRLPMPVGCQGDGTRTAASPADDALLLLVRYSGSSLLLRLIRLIYSYAKPKFLEPAFLGIWNLLNLVPSYGSYLHLGSRNALEFRLPRLLADGKTDEAATVVGCVYRATLAANGTVSIGLMLLATFGGFDEAISFGLMSMAAALPLIWYYDQQLAVLKAEQRFEVIASANFLKAVALIGVSIPMVVLWRFPGVCIGFVLSYAFADAYLRWRNPMTRVGRFDWKTFIGLVREGAPVLAFVVGVTILTTTDRMVIASMIGVKAAGYYSVAQIAATFALQVPTSARDMREPQLMANLGAGPTAELWRDYMLTPLLNAACYFPLIVGGLAFLADDVLALLLPAYLDSALPAVVLCGGCYFLVQVQIARGILVANGWQLRVLPFQLCGAAASVALSVSFVRLGWDITGVAASSSIGFALTMTAILLFAFRRSPLPAREWVSVMAAVILAPGMSLAAIWVIIQTLAPQEAGLSVSIGSFLAFLLIQLLLVTAWRRAFPSIRRPPVPWRRSRRSRR